MSIEHLKWKRNWTVKCIVFAVWRSGRKQINKNPPACSIVKRLFFSAHNSTMVTPRYPVAGWSESKLPKLCHRVSVPSWFLKTISSDPRPIMSKHWTSENIPPKKLCDMLKLGRQWFWCKFKFPMSYDSVLRNLGYHIGPTTTTYSPSMQVVPVTITDLITSHMPTKDQNVWISLSNDQ